MTAATAQVRHEGDTMVIELTGDWELAEATPEFVPPPVAGRSDRVAVTTDGAAVGLAAGTTAGSTAGSTDGAVDFDASGLGSWDSSLLTYLLQAMRYCEAHDIQFREENLPKEITGLLALARAVPERVIDREPAASTRIARLGSRGVAAWDATLESVAFLGEVTGSLARLLMGRGRLRWRDFWVVVQSNSAGALPIVTLIAFLVGVIISFLGAVVLRRFGAGYYVSYLVGYGMLREMAALMTGIIMAGRTGAAFAAELGSMKITEEVDAFRTLGISPVDYLVMPRVLGLFVTMPLLTVYAGFVGILGGMLVAITLLDLSATQFITGLLMAVTLPDGLLGVFKGTVFGLIIGLAGCMKGMQTGADAGAVGQSATSAVVLGITLIIAANALIDWLAVLLNI